MLDRRPRSVTWLAWAVLIFSALGIIRFFASFQIPAIELSVPTWYFTLTGALWGGIGLGLSIGLFLGRSWAAKLTRWLSVVYVLWYWLDRLLFVKTEYARGSTGAALGATMIGLSLVFWVLHRSQAASFFKETA
jgi:hypothetical protein